MNTHDRPETKKKKKTNAYTFIVICCVSASAIFVALMAIPLANSDRRMTYAHGFQSDSSISFVSSYSDNIEIQSAKGFWYYSEGNMYINCLNFNAQFDIEIDNSIVKITRGIHIDIDLYVDIFNGDNTLIAESVLINKDNLTISIYDIDNGICNISRNLAVYIPESDSDAFMNEIVCKFYAFIEYQYYDQSDAYYDLICKNSIGATFHYIPLEEQTIATIGKSLGIIGGCGGSIMLVGLVTRKRKNIKDFNDGLHDFDIISDM